MTPPGSGRWWRRRASEHTYDQCLAGLEPAETLDTMDREFLVMELHAAGWTDLDIAIHTRMTSYTTTRIRTHLQLTANPRSGRHITRPLPIAPLRYIPEAGR